MDMERLTRLKRKIAEVSTNDNSTKVIIIHTIKTTLKSFLKKLKD